MPNTITITRTSHTTTNEEISLPAYFKKKGGCFFYAVLSNSCMLTACTLKTFAEASIGIVNISRDEEPCSKEDFDAAYQKAQLMVEDAFASLSMQPVQPLESFVRESNTPSPAFA